VFRLLVIGVYERMVLCSRQWWWLVVVSRNVVQWSYKKLVVQYVVCIRVTRSIKFGDILGTFSDLTFNVHFPLEFEVASHVLHVIV
jgi:hypothetical protein